MKYTYCILICILANSAFSSMDTGVVSKYYTDENGEVAIQIEGGFTEAVKEGECENLSAHSWAGRISPTPAMRSALLTAKARGSNVSISIEGCEDEDWFKIKAIYIND